MTSPRVALVLVASLAALAPGRDRGDTVDVSSTTMLIVRDEARAGTLYTIAPVYEILSLSARNIENPVAEDLKLVVSTWGAGSLGKNLVWYGNDPPVAPGVRQSRPGLRAGRAPEAHGAAARRPTARGGRRRGLESSSTERAPSSGCRTDSASPASSVRRCRAASWRRAGTPAGTPIAGTSPRAAGPPSPFLHGARWECPPCSSRTAVTRAAAGSAPTCASPHGVRSPSSPTPATTCTSPAGWRRPCSGSTRSCPSSSSRRTTGTWTPTSSWRGARSWRCSRSTGGTRWAWAPSTDRGRRSRSPATTTT